MENWQINISLIPSIAVILTSANRLALGLTDEINSRLTLNIEAYREILPLKIQQLKRLSLSIVLMYISLSFLIINALISALFLIPSPFDKLLILISILIFLIAIVIKIRFSVNAYKIRQMQFKNFLKLDVSINQKDYKA